MRDLGIWLPERVVDGPTDTAFSGYARVAFEKWLAGWLVGTMFEGDELETRFSSGQVAVITVARS